MLRVLTSRPGATGKQLISSRIVEEILQAPQQLSSMQLVPGLSTTPKRTVFRLARDSSPVRIAVGWLSVCRGKKQLARVRHTDPVVDR